MMVTTVRGQFETFTAELDLNEQHPEASRVAVTIEAASIDTGVDYRDSHLRGEDFFDVERFPTITYTSKRVEKLSETQYRVVGDLTLHGVTHEVPLKFTVGGPYKNAMGLRAGAFAATATISRKKFGMIFNMALEDGGWMVSDKVELSIQAEVVEPVAVPALAG
jgi:polyisoprenoid-binding protein YceI